MSPLYAFVYVLETFSSVFCDDVIHRHVQMFSHIFHVEENFLLHQLLPKSCEALCIYGMFVVLDNAFMECLLYWIMYLWNVCCTV